MTDTVPTRWPQTRQTRTRQPPTRQPPTRQPSARARDSAIGTYRHRRSVTEIGLGLLAGLLSKDFLDRHDLRDPLNRGLKFGVRHGFGAVAASTRQFAKVSAIGRPPTRLEPSTADYFDLTPDDDQKMIVETVNEFAEEILRPAARDADDAAACPADLTAKAAELGITALKVPEEFDGAAENRTCVTSALVAEALAYGDMGLALPILAPGGVASALAHFGSADQQGTYLSEFAGDNVPQACVAIAEPHPNVLNRTSVMILFSTLIWISMRSPQTGLPSTPTPSGASSSPTFRGILKCSSTLSL